MIEIADQIVQDVFKKIYYINLDRRVDRMRQLSANVPFSFEIMERISALDKNSIKREYFQDDNFCPQTVDFFKRCLQNMMVKLPRKRIKLGEVALSLTNYALWLKIANDDELSDDDLVLILEDDVRFADIFISTLEKHSQSLKTHGSDLGVIYLGGRRVHKYMPKPNIVSHWERYECENESFPVYMRPVKVVKGYHFDRESHAIAYTKATIVKMLNMTGTDFLNVAIDHFLSHLAFRGMPTTDFLPHICYAKNSSDSDIQCARNIISHEKLYKSCFDSDIQSKNI